MTTLPYGSWPSPISAELLVQDAVRLGELWVDDRDLYWLERRPAEAGRQVVVRRSGYGSVSDAVPTGFSARTTVHEYGGGSYVVHDGVVYFSNFEDQRVWRAPIGESPSALTPEPADRTAVRYADYRVVPDQRVLVCVRERHEPGGVINELAAVPVSGGEPYQLVGGHDFFAAPRPSPDGRRLAWLSWDHPNMPWDGTELWVADFAGGRLTSEPLRVAGGPAESVSQPRWSGDGSLHWVSDRTGWWNLYRDGESLAAMEAEFAGPDWVFGQSTFVCLADGRLVVSWSKDGLHHLGVVDPATRRLEPIDTPYTSFHSLQPWAGGVAAIAASPTEPPAVVSISTGGRVEVLKRSRAQDVDAGYVSAPRPIDFTSEDGRTAHALYYPPANRDVEGPPDERPPLVVMSHGGPTSATSAELNLGIQYWTSRGIAVVDVNYGGSTGYGRAYRELLNGRWGIVDVDDCVHAALHLVAGGEVDGDRLAIRGGSAGGYTTLSALTFRDVFAAGASHYGVADLETLARDTHKFESRYLDRLVGPYPDARDLYQERSPIHFADQIDCPLILFQGLEDKVVPPSQAEVLVDALRESGVPFAYLTFEGEQHGFRRAETIVRVTEAELSFYGQVLGFEPADGIEPVEIENADALGDDVDEIVFDLSGWDPELRAELVATLDAERLPYDWEGDADLVVDAEDAEVVEELIDELVHPDALDAEEPDEGDEDAAELMSALFVASDRLAQNPAHSAAAADLVEAVVEAGGVGSPYGIDRAAWEKIVGLARDLAGTIHADGGLEELHEKARALRDALRPYV